MFTHILVPIDLGDRNARALRTALELARRSRTRVTLLHVVQSVPNLPPAEFSAEGRLDRDAAGRFIV